jgi:hypothetical protein
MSETTTETDPTQNGDQPQVIIRLGQNRQVIEIDGRAWHLAPTDNGSALVLGEETFSTEEVVNRTQAMLDAVVAWHDHFMKSRRAMSAPVTLDMFDRVDAWREATGR